MNKIIILLSAYNGAKYLKNQIDSLVSQTYDDFRIIARDDGSSDESLAILKSYDKIEIVDSRQNLGAKGSFSELLEYAVKHTDGEFFMFCDQDDVWKNDKVEKTLAKMQELEKLYGDIPLLVHTDLEIVDKDLKTISSSMWQYEKINPNLNTLNRLLAQNTITGCTMMINRALAQKSLPISEHCIMHDWWIGLVASCYGKIGYVSGSTIKYRQHGKNDTGAKNYNYKFIISKLKKFNELNIDKNILQAKGFLETYERDLDKEKRELLEDFSNIKEKSFLQRVCVLVKYKIFKYGMIRNMGMIVKI